mgnify:FL=1
MSRIRKLVGIVRRVVCCVMSIALLASGTAAQTKGITFSMNNIPAKKVLEKIERDYGYVFLYNEEQVKLDRNVSVSVKDAGITEVMDKVLWKGLDYKVRGRQVTITKSPVTPPQRTETQNAKKTERSGKVTGVVTDGNGEPLIGAGVMLKGTKIGTTTDIDGRFSINVKGDGGVLEVSYINFVTQDIPIKGMSNIHITLQEDAMSIQETIVVGYGTQKKESVVGAIAQTKGEQLMKTGVQGNVGQMLSGLMPGLSTQTASDMPGNDDPTITIRGLSSWNGASPLILIDGVERKMSDIDAGQIESISVLKDASATAVFGVKGAEGVILITTKRGKEGRASVSFSANTTFKVIGEMPDIQDAYDTYRYQNELVEKSLPYDEASWGYFSPVGETNKYRHPASRAESDLYPNVNWPDAITKDFAMTQRYDLNVTGGAKFAKYFAAVSYLKDDDLLKSGGNDDLPFKPQFGFEHYNIRLNVDLNFTPTTTVSVNLAGSLRMRDEVPTQYGEIWDAFYSLPPSIFPIQYVDGAYGSPYGGTEKNPVAVLSGSTNFQKKNTAQMMSDITLKQKLDFVTKGLSASGTFSFDTRFFSLRDFGWSSVLSKAVDRNTGSVIYYPATGDNDMDYYPTPPWFDGEKLSVNSTVRRTYYKVQADYARSFGKHDVTGLALMSREQMAEGSEFPHYREDWVGRFTYAYNNRYFVEANGSYNGSEKFASKYRFGFFPSLGLGWQISDERFFKPLDKVVDKLKFRYSIGQVGSDNFAAQRWAYMSTWSVGDNNAKGVFGTVFQGPYGNSPGASYLQYKEAQVGNPELQWEVSTKQNIGIEFAFFNHLISGSLDVFQDNRDKVFLSAAQRASSVPGYFGAAPVAANLGKVRNRGFELDVTLRRSFSEWNTWIRYTFAHAKEVVLAMDDPELIPDYQKNEGFRINQPKTYVDQDKFITSWDDVYGRVGGENNTTRLPGSVANIDYNADGVINENDKIPYGYPERPENTYNIFLGFDYKGLSAQVHFLGVYNISRNFAPTLTKSALAPYATPRLWDYWTPDNTDALYALGGGNSTRGVWLDGSYLRFKSAEISYTFTGKILDKLRMSSLKLTAAGHNLFFWSKMPEEREEYNYTNRYPPVKRFSFGLNVTF